MDIKIPSVLSYTRKISLSDGCLYATVWNDRNTRTARGGLFGKSDQA